MRRGHRGQDSITADANVFGQGVDHRIAVLKFYRTSKLTPKGFHSDSLTTCKAGAWCETGCSRLALINHDILFEEKLAAGTR
jgi:hypothetical protein